MTRQPTPDILGNIMAGSPAPTLVALTAIVNDGGTQMRASMDADTVKEYEDALADAEAWPFPPVVVYHDGARYWLADGFHRLNAAHRSGKFQEIPAEIKAGTRRDAVLFAACANASHGLRRSPGDKKRAVEALLKDEEWSKWSDREIARRCAVSQPFVSALRKELSDNGYQMPTERTVERAGQTYQQNTANIGANRQQPPAMLAVWELEKTVRTIYAQIYVGNPEPYATRDMRQGARQRTGRFWLLCVKTINADNWRHSDLAQAINNVAAHIEAQRDGTNAQPNPILRNLSQPQMAQRSAQPATDDLHPGAGRTPPQPLTMQELVEDLDGYLAGVPAADINAAARGANNQALATARQCLADFTYRQADLYRALEKLALQRGAPATVAEAPGESDMRDYTDMLSPLPDDLVADGWALRGSEYGRYYLINERTARTTRSCATVDKAVEIARGLMTGQWTPPAPGGTMPQYTVPEEMQPATIAQTVADVVEVYGGEPAPVAEPAEVLPVSQRSDYESDEWYTPQEYIDAAKTVMGAIDLDPASSEMAQTVVRAGVYRTRFDDGLSQVRWLHQRIWLNPPYSNPAPWIEKLVREHQAGPYCTEAIVLVNNATETSWFQLLLERFPVCLPARRLAFWRHDHANVGARQGQAFFYLGPNAAKFQEVFGQFGPILRRLS